MYKYSLYKEINFDRNFYLKTNTNTGISRNILSTGLKGYYKNINQNYEYSYIYEKDENFNTVKEVKIQLDNEFDYKLKFIGTKDEELNLLLYVLTYKFDKKIYNENMTINTEKNIVNIVDGEYIKLAIRLANLGGFLLEKVLIYRKRKIEYITEEEIKKLEHDNMQLLSDLRVACIFDPLTMECYEDMCKLIKITPDDWKIELEINRPSILIVESAWHGNDNTWEQKVQHINKYNTEKLKNIIVWCKHHKVPTVFWNKEDPVHYEHFIETAKLFDYVFTTDKDSIDRYKIELNHENIYELLFAAQPKKHNPIKIYDERIKKACFAGSFYNNKYPERRKNLENILRLAIEYIGLDIYDRNYNTQYIQYRYPEEFSEYIKGYLSPNELEKSNKGYKIMINTNSVVDSSTMFSRRVFEGLACGTPIISSYSLGINNIFKDIVLASNDVDELRDEFLKLRNDSYYNNKMMKGIRFVLSNHTYRDRILFILDKVGIKVYNQKVNVGVFSLIETIDEFIKVKIMYDKQVYEYKSLYILTKNKDVYDYIKKTYNNLNVILYSNENNQQDLYDLQNIDYIGIINNKNYYGKYYLIDLVNATLYTDAEFIGKKTFFKNISRERFFNIPIKKNEIDLINKNREFQYVELLDLDKSIFKYKILDKYTLNEVVQIIENNNIDKFKFGYRYFSIDKFNFIEGIENINLNDIDI